MSIEQHTWEAMVNHARNLKPQVGTIKAIRYAMQAGNTGFRDEDAEYAFVIAMERAINGPRPWPEWIPPVAVKRLDAGPAVKTPIPQVNLPRPESVWISESYAAAARKLFVYTDRARLIGSRGKPRDPRDPMAPIPNRPARIVRRSQAVLELADKVNADRL